MIRRGLKAMALSFFGLLVLGAILGDPADDAEQDETTIVDTPDAPDAAADPATLLGPAGSDPAPPAPTTSSATSSTAETPPDLASAISPPVADATRRLGMLEVAEPDPEREPYERDSYDGDGWADADADCVSTRHELLADRSVTPVEFATSGCSVATGTWVDPYDGATHTSADQVSIDHLVALADAHRSGAWRWDAATKQRFANDETPGHLIVVGLDSNQSKADKSPDDWLPPDPAAHCQYAIDWIRSKSRYRLTVTEPEQVALSSILAGCDTSSRLGPVVASAPPLVTVTTPTTTTSTTIATSAGPGMVVLLECNRRAEEVTIANIGGAPVSLADHTLRDEGLHHEVDLGGFGSLAAGQTLVITSGPTASNDDPGFWTSDHVWNNDGDAATIVTPDGRSMTVRC